MTPAGILLGSLLGVATAWSWRTTGLERGRTALGFGWTLFWAELFAGVWFRPPGPPPVVPVWQVAGEHGVHLTPDMLEPPPEDGPSIVFIGDSFTAGQGVPIEQAFPSLVETALTPDHPGLTVQNHGILGDSFFAQALRMPLLEHADGHDVIVHVFFLNDLGVEAPPDGDFVSVGPRPAAPSALLAALERSAKARVITRRTEAAYLEGFAPDATVWQAFVPALTRRVRATRDRGARYLFVVFPVLYRLDDYPFAQAHTRLIAAAQDAGAETLDLLETFRDREASTLWFHPLDHHPNARAHALAATPIVDALRTARLPTHTPPSCAKEQDWSAPIDAAWKARCATPGPLGLLHAAEAIAATPPSARADHVDGGLVAAGLAHIASHRLGPRHPDTTRAEALRDGLVESFRAGRR